MAELITRFNDIYKRQTDLTGPFEEKSAIVVGLGGIGSWVALDLALLGVGTLILVDHDKIEASNLNRTLYKLDQIGKLKTDAIRELIHERRPDTIMMTINDYFQEKLLETYDVNYFFDCTDNLQTRKIVGEYNKAGDRFLPYIKLGYDGFLGTITMNEYERGRWGDEGSYFSVSSFFGTPQILSAIGVIELLMKYPTDEYCINISVKTIIDKFKKEKTT